MAVKKTNDMAPRTAKKTPATADDAFRSNRQSDYTTKFTVQIDSGLHRRLKLTAALEGRTMREITEDALEKYIQTKGEPLP